MNRLKNRIEELKAGEGGDRSIKALADKYSDYIVDRRRSFHRHPELSFQEWRTTAVIKKDLEEMGIAVETFGEKPGLVGTLDSGRPGRTVMLRADIDALPIQEKTNLSFASENQGIMHACGHDTHAAMLLGAAKILSELKDELCGTVKFLFESGEEVAEGSEYCISQNVLDGVDAMFGVHIWGTLDAPYLCVDSGRRMASCDIFSIKIKGQQAHGSAPHLGKDAIVAASAVVMALQTFVSRVNDPANPLVLTVGKFEGGQRFNIICGEVNMEGTIRTFSPEFRHKMGSMLSELIKETARAYGCSAEFNLVLKHPAVVNNNTELNEIARNAAIKLYGQEGIKSMENLMASEDFSMFMQQVPGFFAFVGARNTKKDIIYSNHNEKFTVDEDVLRRGSALEAQFAMDYLLQK